MVESAWAYRDCEYCGRPVYGRSYKHCSKECRKKDEEETSDFAKRLHDGSRLQSDDFGEEPGDELVMYQ